MIKKIILVISMFCIIASNAFAMENENNTIGPINWNTTTQQLEENFNITQIIHQKDYEHIVVNKISNKNHEKVFINDIQFTVNKNLNIKTNCEIDLWDGQISKIKYTTIPNEKNFKKLQKEFKKHYGKQINKTKDSHFWKINNKLICITHEMPDDNLEKIDYKKIVDEIEFTNLSIGENLNENDKERWGKTIILSKKLNAIRKHEKEFNEKNPKLYQACKEFAEKLHSLTSKYYDEVYYE